MINKKIRWIVALGLIVASGVLFSSPHLAKAACSITPDPAKGTSTQNINVTSAGTYYVWSRILAPDTTNNSYHLQVDGGCAYDVGDSSTIPANTWTWVNYQNGTSNSPISLNLTAGSHQVVMTGNEGGVGVDRLLFLTDQTCVPSGNGNNCTPVVDTTPPTVNLTAPTGGSTVSGTVSVTANASDNVAVTSVQFKLDGANLGAVDTTAPYTASWNTTTVANGTHTLTAVASDGTNSTTSSPVTVTVNNQNSPPPPPPYVQGFSFNASTKTLSWTAYPGASSYNIAEIHNPTSTRNTNYAWPHITGTSCVVGTTCNIPLPASGEVLNFGILPLDSNGNTVTGSSWLTPELTVTWPTAPDTTAPSVPTGVSATAASTSQINLSWAASTDTGGSGLAGYNVYRSSGADSSSLIATVTTTSFGDTGLSPGTAYSYFVTAIDGAKNESGPSTTVTATTQTNSRYSAIIQGVVTNSVTNQPVQGVLIKTGTLATANGAISTLTNAQGQFVLSGIDTKSSHNYYISASGYVSQHYVSTFPPGITIANVSLVPKK